MTYTTAPCGNPLPPNLSLAQTRAERTEVRELIATRRGVSAITEALTAEQMCRRASILLGQHRDHLTISDGNDWVQVTPSCLPHIDPQHIADAMTEWVRQHPHHVASAA